ncbi:hypothetical protein HanRHA438_Chr08g0371421 [Helianthus annuus]|nr:hypothetical protein HanRHA438_Chr08g0371421 [Helianthus annuus]
MNPHHKTYVTQRHFYADVSIFTYVSGAYVLCMLHIGRTWALVTLKSARQLLCTICYLPRQCNQLTQSSKTL